MTSRSTARADLYGWLIVAAGSVGLGLAVSAVTLRLLNRHEARRMNRPTLDRAFPEPIGFRR